MLTQNPITFQGVPSQNRLSSKARHGRDVWMRAFGQYKWLANAGLPNHDASSAAARFNAASSTPIFSEVRIVRIGVFIKGDAHDQPDEGSHNVQMYLSRVRIPDRRADVRPLTKIVPLPKEVCPRRARYCRNNASK
jgi:hypothetical protein